MLPANRKSSRNSTSGSLRLALARHGGESLGIVYTPTEVVDYIVRSVEDVLNQEFGVSVGDEGVHVLDPFVGTGTFITRLHAERPHPSRKTCSGNTED